MPTALPRQSTTPKAVVVVAAAVLVLVASSLTGQRTTSLRDLADGHGLRVGAAMNLTALRTEPRYGEALAREFDIVTPENEMKWAEIHPQRLTYDFADADEIVAFAAARGMVVRGHTLVWHEQNPSWLNAVSGGEMADVLRDHIAAVVGRYAGRYVAAWDVVNEAVDDDGTLRNTIWRQRLGNGYVDTAFRLAHAADPDATLVYNDYGTETINVKSTAVYSLLRDMVARAVPVHAVGFQMHITTAGIDLESFRENIRRFASLGLQIHITELDVRSQLPPNLIAQADVYRSVLDVCLEFSACKTFQMWGFTDAHSWIPDRFPGFGAALIFDENYRTKPAYDALSDRLSLAPRTPPTPPSTPPPESTGVPNIAGIWRITFTNPRTSGNHRCFGDLDDPEVEEFVVSQAGNQVTLIHPDEPEQRYVGVILADGTFDATGTYGDSVERGTITFLGRRTAASGLVGRLMADFQASSGDCSPSASLEWNFNGVLASPVPNLTGLWVGSQRREWCENTIPSVSCPPNGEVSAMRLDLLTTGPGAVTGTFMVSSGATNASLNGVVSTNGDFGFISSGEQAGNGRICPCAFTRRGRLHVSARSITGYVTYTTVNRGSLGGGSTSSFYVSATRQ